MRLTTDWLLDWRRRTADDLTAIDALFEEVHGYSPYEACEVCDEDADCGCPPPGGRVVPADERSRALAERHAAAPGYPAELALFHRVVAEAWLMNVDHGYHLAAAGRPDCCCPGPGHEELAAGVTGFPLGSDGGGLIFAVGTDGRVYRSAGASWESDFEPVQPDLRSFLEWLADAVADFRERTEAFAAAG
ncbi:hypothetical protein ACIA8O_34595 [Kitasatospora sp. NPDC051853]|uniref:hypothetical protein n=1 Tax=Kitasatospora sp. NPDC051853 TaxID=3364058 RepID=UPI0037BD3C67